jgi:hypothetical protein
MTSLMALHRAEIIRLERERDAALALAERRAGVITQLSAMMRGVEDALVRGETTHATSLVNRAIIHAIAAAPPPTGEDAGGTGRMDEARRVAVHVEVLQGGALVHDMEGPVSFLLPTAAYGGSSSLEESRDPIVGALRMLASRIETESHGTMPVNLPHGGTDNGD